VERRESQENPLIVSICEFFIFFLSKAESAMARRRVGRAPVPMASHKIQKVWRETGSSGKAGKEDEERQAKRS
jgi:hypothetical protein